MLFNSFPFVGLVLCTGVLHHLADPAAALGQLSTALAPGGGVPVRSSIVARSND